MTISIARVRASEAVPLSEFASRCFDDTYGPLCRAADVDAYIAQSLSASALLSALTDPTSWVLAASIDDAWVGYAHLQLSPLPDGVTSAHTAARSVTPMVLSRFYVTRKWHGKGVAGELMASVFEQTATAGSETLWLSAWKENARAIAFYKKWGFQIIGTSTFLMGEDLQEDFVMERVMGAPDGSSAAQV